MGSLSSPLFLISHADSFFFPSFSPPCLMGKVDTAQIPLLGKLCLSECKQHFMCKCPLCLTRNILCYCSSNSFKYSTDLSLFSNMQSQKHIHVLQNQNFRYYIIRKLPFFFFFTFFFFFKVFPCWFAWY